MVTIFIIVFIFFFFFFGFAILAEFNQGTYSQSIDGYDAKQGIKNYRKDYPEKRIRDLKSDIEEVANRLVENEECNRYTENLRKKASKDKDIKRLSNEFVDDVKILKYKDKKLRAKVDYLLDDKKYSLLFDMDTVSKGKVFLRKYNILKEKNKLDNIYLK